MALVGKAVTSKPQGAWFDSRSQTLTLGASQGRISPINYQLLLLLERQTSVWKFFIDGPSSNTATLPSVLKEQGDVGVKLGYGRGRVVVWVNMFH